MNEFIPLYIYMCMRAEKRVGICEERVTAEKKIMRKEIKAGKKSFFCKARNEENGGKKQGKREKIKLAQKKEKKFKKK